MGLILSFRHSVLNKQLALSSIKGQISALGTLFQTLPAANYLIKMFVQVHFPVTLVSEFGHFDTQKKPFEPIGDIPPFILMNKVLFLVTERRVCELVGSLM